MKALCRHKGVLVYDLEESDYTGIPDDEEADCELVEMKPLPGMEIIAGFEWDTVGWQDLAATVGVLARVFGAGEHALDRRDRIVVLRSEVTRDNYLAKHTAA